MSDARAMTSGATPIPLLDDDVADLSLASTLCGACASVCPVGIDLPWLLHLARAGRAAAGRAATGERATRLVFRWAAANPTNYRLLHRSLRAGLTSALAPPLRAWSAGRNLPRPAPRLYRDQWKARGKP
jgi:L-lactate dehydrogenase complex protein LldF